MISPEPPAAPARTTVTCAGTDLVVLEVVVTREKLVVVDDVGAGVAVVNETAVDETAVDDTVVGVELVVGDVDDEPPHAVNASTDRHTAYRPRATATDLGFATSVTTNGPLTNPNGSTQNATKWAVGIAAIAGERGRQRSPTASKQRVITHRTYDGIDAGVLALAQLPETSYKSDIHPIAISVEPLATGSRACRAHTDSPPHGVVDRSPQRFRWPARCPTRPASRTARRVGRAARASHDR